MDIFPTGTCREDKTGIPAMCIYAPCWIRSNENKLNPASGGRKWRQALIKLRFSALALLSATFCRASTDEVA